ncbi:MAG TPA: hypothetical protein V6C78_21170 [Crinalium sp.]
MIQTLFYLRLLQKPLHRKFVSITAFTLFFGIGSSASAITLVKDKALFHNSNSIVSIETFDDFGTSIFPGASVTFDSVTYTDLTAPFWVTGSVSPGALFSNAVAPNELSFGINQFTKAIGFDLIPFEKVSITPSTFEFQVQETNGQTTTFVSVPEPDVKNFFGFSSSKGIQKLTVLQPPSQDGATNFSFDNVSRAAITTATTTTDVPEPSSILSLVVFGLMGLGMKLKHKRS